MAEIGFERRLERLFGDAPELPDAAAFAGAVERRLDRGWTARRWLIGSAGVVGGLIGASQLLFSGLFRHLATAEGSARALGRSLAASAPVQWIETLPSGGGVVWVSLGVAVLMTGFVLTRLIEEI